MCTSLLFGHTATTTGYSKKQKASQKNPKPYPKKVLINTNNNKENSHQKPSDQSFFFHQILTRDKTSKHRIKQLQCKWEGLLI
jgi:hypothetical protein